MSTRTSPWLLLARGCRCLRVRVKHFWRTRSPIARGAIIAGIAMLAVVLAAVGIRHAYGPDEAAKVADTLGGLGAVVATGFVALTLYLQSRELQLQREELRMTRDELAKHGEQLERQADVLAQGLLLDAPRLEAEFNVRSQGKGRWSVRITNIGTSNITHLLVVPRSFKGGGIERDVPKSQLGPKEFVEAFEITEAVPENVNGAEFAAGPGAKLALTKLHCVADMLVTFRDARGAEHVWVIATERFKRAASTQLYPDSPAR